MYVMLHCSPEHVLTSKRSLPHCQSSSRARGQRDEVSTIGILQSIFRCPQGENDDNDYTNDNDNDNDNDKVKKVRTHQRPRNRKAPAAQDMVPDLHHRGHSKVQVYRQLLPERLVSHFARLVTSNSADLHRTHCRGLENK